MTDRLSASKDIAAPREGASIAVFKDRSVLLLKRARPPFAGLWSLPGGKSEGAEAPRETACRELMEETGIEAEVKGIADILWIAADEGNGASITYRLTVFYGRHAGGSLKAGGDTEAAAWVHLDEIEALPMTEGTTELIRLAAHRLRRP
ncbi:MAG TPA: NUDIX domain-containing protein [Methyloceanibacter sp.]|jgi:ADP-ribose pyrophosphatase YjhB (NUDIX family)|nr:NUDIX domain-containing protein [Methyloceanibacter sp.]